MGQQQGVWMSDVALVKVDSPKTTWPLPFESSDGSVSITSLLESCGWNSDQINAARSLLFDLKEQSGVHPTCTEEEVCWPDLQQVFRHTVAKEPWSEKLIEQWPPLDGRRVTLRLKVDPDEIVSTLEGPVLSHA